VTARRWARILRGLGHRVAVATSWRGEPCDTLVVLHARRGADSVRRWRRAKPDAPLVVALTGTDQYVDLPRGSKSVRATLDAATRIVALHETSRAALPAAWRTKARVVPASAEVPASLPPKDRRGFLVVNLGHLRPVKDPFLAAKATQLLPRTSRVRVVHAGEALSPAMARRARAESRTNPRWRWVGGLPGAAAMRLLARARLLVVTSKAEGAPGVVVEATALGTPVVATRIDGVVGVLGAEHPGLFAAGDAAALAATLRRAETDPRFLSALSLAGARRARLSTPTRERAAWRSLLAEFSGRRRSSRNLAAPTVFHRRTE
jgi:putative glycosyltransferase (TIGR04348 family)